MMIGKAVDDMYVGTLPEDAYPSDKDQPTFKAYLTVIVRDAHGNIIKVHKQWSHSPTSNFMSLMVPYNYYTNTRNGPPITNTGGSKYNYYSATWPMYYPNSVKNCQSYLVMIQVGSGSQSNPYTATSLAAPIANGTGGGQLVYGASTVSSTPTVSGNSAYFIISQAYFNNSGGTVVITEVGILISICVIVNSTASITNIGNFLVWYDVLSSSISVPNGGSVDIYYTFTVNP